MNKFFYINENKSDIMKKEIYIKFVYVLLVGLMVSCSTSNEVASNRSIQKRKYTKGYFFDFNKKLSGIK